MQQLRAELKIWMKEHGKSRDWVAEKLGVGKRTVDSWFSYKQIPEKKQKLLRELMKKIDSEKVLKEDVSPPKEKLHCLNCHNNFICPSELLGTPVPCPDCKHIIYTTPPPDTPELVPVWVTLSPEDSEKATTWANVTGKSRTEIIGAFLKSIVDTHNRKNK